MDIGLKKWSPADDIGARIRVDTQDGLTTGTLDLFCPQTGLMVLSDADVDGEFEGEIRIPDRDIIPDPVTGCKYQVLEPVVRQQELHPVLLIGMENLRIDESVVQKVDKNESTDKQNDDLPDDLIDFNRPLSALEMEAIADQWTKETEKEVKRSKDPNAKYMRIRASGKDDASADEDESESEEQDDDEDGVEDWDTDVLDADIVVIRSSKGPEFKEAVRVIRLNNRIGVCFNGKEISRFQAIDFVTISCMTEETGLVIFLFPLKQADGSLDEGMAVAISHLFQSDPTIVKVVHNVSPVADMLRHRFSVNWTADEVEDSMCCDMELRAERRELEVRRDSRKGYKPLPRADVHVEELLVRYLDLDFGADCFPHFQQVDEHKCVMDCLSRSRTATRLSIEAVNFVKRKTLFLPLLVDEILGQAASEGLPLKELRDLIDTRLEVRRESSDEDIAVFQAEEKYYVTMSNMYVNPHSMRRRDADAIRIIRETAEQAVVPLPRPFTIDHLNWIDNKDIRSTAGDWLPQYRAEPEFRTSVWRSRPAKSQTSSDLGLGGSDADEEPVFQWPSCSEARSEDRRHWFSSGQSSAPGGHAHNLNQRRGPKFAAGPIGYNT